MDTVRQRTVAPAPGFHAPVDIAVLTDRGRAEFTRLEHDERLLTWTAQRMNDYVLAAAEPQAVTAAEIRS
jgi:hypothetical protein